MADPRPDAVSKSLDEARAALRTRQGTGARYDAPAAPAAELEMARRGTAYFARILNNLGDADLDRPCARTDTTRRAIVAAVGLQARVMAETVAWCRVNGEQTLPWAFELDPANLALATTMPPQALRNLFAHSEVHLNVEWRDMIDADWEFTVPTRTGETVALRSLPLFRALSLWKGSLDLGAGGRLADVPRVLMAAPSIAGFSPL